MDSNEEARSLWVGAVQPNWDEAYLYSLFAATGEVVRVKMMRNPTTGIPAGYAFVEFRTVEAAKQVLEQLNGKPIPGTSLSYRLNWATRRGGEASMAQHSLFVGDLSPEVTDQALLAVFQVKYPSCIDAKVIIDPSTGQSKGYGFVRFIEKPESERAMNEMNGVMIGSRPVRVGPATQRRNDGPMSPSSATAQFLNHQAVVAAAAAAAHMAPPSMAGPPSPQVTTMAPPLYGFASSQQQSPSISSPQHQQQQQQQHQQEYGLLQQQQYYYQQQQEPLSNTTTVFVGNLDPSQDQETVHEHFKGCGTIESIKIPHNRGCGFVKFASRAEAEKAIATLDGTTLGKSKLRLGWGKFSNPNKYMSAPSSPLAGPMPMTVPTNPQMLPGMMYVPGWQQMYYPAPPPPPQQGYYYGYPGGFVSPTAGGPGIGGSPTGITPQRPEFFQEQMVMSFGYPPMQHQQQQMQIEPVSTQSSPKSGDSTTIEETKSEKNIVDSSTRANSSGKVSSSANVSIQKNGSHSINKQQPEDDEEQQAMKNKNNKPREEDFRNHTTRRTKIEEHTTTAKKNNILHK